MVKIIIPSLPNLSLNDNAHWTRRSALAKKALRTQAFDAACEAGVQGLMMTPVEIHFSFYVPARRTDLDNHVTACKSWLDGLTAPRMGPKGQMSIGASVIPDDRPAHLYRLTYEWFPCKGEGYTVIEVVQRTDTK